MIRSFEYVFNSHIDIVFDNLVHQGPYYDVEFLKIMKSHESIYEDGEYIGFKMSLDVGGEIAKLEYRISHYEKNTEVRYIDQGTVFENGKTASEMEGFPFKKNNFTLVFSESSAGTKVLTRYHFEPKGLFGWLICFFYVFPSTKKQTINGYNALNEILSKKI